MDQDKEIRKFKRAAVAHRDSAGILFRERQYLHAMYHAGYVVECAFKALILTGTPPSEVESTLKTYCKGTAGHNLESLKARLRELGYNMAAEQTANLRRLGSWTTDLRYDVGTVGARTAEACLKAAEALLQWVEDKL